MTGRTRNANPLSTAELARSVDATADALRILQAAQAGRPWSSADALPLRLCVARLGWILSALGAVHREALPS